MQPARKISARAVQRVSNGDDGPSLYISHVTCFYDRLQLARERREK